MQNSIRNSCRIKLVFSQTLYSQSSASITMGSLAAYLRTVGFQVDLCLLGEKNLHNTEMILGDSKQSNIIIAKPNFKDLQTMLPLLERLKLAGLVSRVFFGGPFAKLNATGLMSELPWLDGIFTGQLESSAEQLLSTMSDDLASWNLYSPGTISRDTKTGLVGKQTPSSPPIPLSDLPFPARDIESMENVSYINIEASRGCLFNCSFCHIPLVSEGNSKAMPLNVRDPVLVVDEIEKLNKELGKTLFIFNDSCFWSTKKDDARILRFCDEITRRKLDVRFYIYLKGEPFIGDDVLHALVSAGLVRVFLGVENSVPSSLARFRKKIEADLYETVKAKLNPLGVNIHIGYITVEPHSSLKDVLSNVEYLYRIGKLFRLGVILEPVRAMPGSSLYSELIKDELISPKLRYDEITYGYKFEHGEVGHLLSRWKNMLGNHLKNISYRFEYYGTTGELLRVLAERLDQKFISILESRYSTFNTKKQEGMKILLKYLRSSIDSTRSGRDYLVDSLEHNDQFIREFTQVTDDLALLYGEIVSTIKSNGGQRAVHETYIG